MKKDLFVILCVIVFAGVANASCPVDGVCTATNDLNMIRKSYQPIYQDVSGNVNFDDPLIRLSPADNSQVERTFRTQNEMQNTTNYDSNCQFGVCLPSDNNNMFR